MSLLILDQVIHQVIKIDVSIQRNGGLMARIALFANTCAGIEICRYLVNETSDEIVALYLSGSYPEVDEKIVVESGLHQNSIFKKEDLNSTEHINWLSELSLDVLITVYWPFLLKSTVFSKANKTVNFHPALLPVNRGWYPHVHSIIDGSKIGVTLHSIEVDADTGPVWAQKEVILLPTDTAKVIYDRLQEEIIQLFKQNWFDIREGNLILSAQDESKATYNRKETISELDYIDLNKKYSAQELINILRARTFGDRGFAFFEKNGEKIYMNIRLSTTNDFSD